MSTLLLLWPAFLNGYPLVFSDTGTYLSQAVFHYVGWDRPPFYSLAILPLHLTLTTWPVAVGQALVAAVAVHMLCAPASAGSRYRPTCVVALLAGLSSLPFLASQLMPDLFTGLLVLLIALPFALERGQSAIAVCATAALITFHLSHLLLAAALVAILSLALRPGWRLAARTAAPVVLAGLACLAINLAAHGRASIAPSSSVFLLARLLADGPAMRTLARDCPQAHWQLCGALMKPPASSDDFLWDADSPLAAAGGARAASAEAAEIVRRTLAAEPLTITAIALQNGLTQLISFDTGDGLNAWPRTVAPWITRIFPPPEVAAFERARQQQATLSIPPWLLALHIAAALGGMAGCAITLRRASRPIAIVAGAVLLALPLNAMVTGALSGPHDRYQSRIVWLPLAVCLAAGPAIARPRAFTTPLPAPAT